MAGSNRQDFDDILKAVARRTKQDAEIDDLGKALTIPSYDIQSAQKRNSQDHSHMGSLELLRDWVKTKTSSTMRQTLIDALKKIQREDILSACFPEIVAATVPSIGTSNSNPPTESTSSPSTTPSSTEPGIIMVNKDALFDELSKKFPVGNYTTFCNQMGVDYNEARSRLTRFKDDYNMALRDLLSQWDLRMKSVTRKQLEDALDKADVGGLCSVVKKHYEKDSTGQHSAAGISHPSPSPEDSSGQHGAAGSSHKDKWQSRTVRPANPSPDELDDEMQYVMWESLMKGNALIIGNEKFTVDPRPWADVDINNMKGLLKKLGYDSIDIHSNLSKMGMRDTVREFTEQLKKDNPRSAVVYISSHGNEKGIAGIDGGILQIRDMLEMFSRVLPGKPKVLIIDACWGGDKTSRLPFAESSSSSGPQTELGFPENADIFMIHSTSYGKKTWSYPTKGSWLVDELCEVVYNNDRDLEDLDTIMLRVTKRVRKIQCKDAKDLTDVGTQSTTVFKQGVDRKLFFYPGFPATNA